MPETKDYDTRRAIVRDTIKTDPRATITDFARRIDRNRKYVMDVLRGGAGKRSEPVIREAEKYVNSL